MDLRREFVVRALGGETSLRGLCEEFGISRKTGFKWKQRFLERGLEGLADQSRRPDRSPGGLSEGVVCEIVRLKQAHRHWGPRKIRQLYRRLHGAEGVPGDSSFQRVLDRAGLVEPRRRRPADQGGRVREPVTAAGPNDLWTVDFKGWWYTAGRRRCQPLTVRDAYSRFLLGVRVPADGRSGTIRGEFERLFSCYGLPGAIRSDNGPPFAVWHSPLGLSRLSAWWVALGIDLDRIDPGHPEQNGGHERMHRDIAAEVQGRVEGELSQQAAALELWRTSYNHERPHEGIGMRTPGELYQKSARVFVGTPDELEYPPGQLQRRVTAAGQIRALGMTLGLSKALAGWNVGLGPMGQDVWSVCFGRLCLGQVDLSSGSFWPEPAPITGAPPQTPGFTALGAAGDQANTDGQVNRAQTP